MREIIYLVIVAASSVAAILAWVAKLRWAQEYRDATDRLLQAKDAEISAVRSQFQVLEAASSAKVLEIFRNTKQVLEEHIDNLQAELHKARQAASHADAEHAAHEAGATVDELKQTLAERDHLQEQVELLEVQLVEAQRLGRTIEESQLEWLRDRQDAQTKLQNYRERGNELREQIRQIRELGPEGMCPTCGRSLGDDYERILEEVEDQWANVVQDGKWWKSRLEQLEKRSPP